MRQTLTPYTGKHNTR